MRMSFTLLAEHAGTAGIYLDAAAGVTVLILLGRYFEARAKRAQARRCGRWRRWPPRTPWCSGTAGRPASR
jgi:cation transport ATPase